MNEKDRLLFEKTLIEYDDMIEEKIKGIPVYEDIIKIKNIKEDEDNFLWINALNFNNNDRSFVLFSIDNSLYNVYVSFLKKLSLNLTIPIRYWLMPSGLRVIKRMTFE